MVHRTIRNACAGAAAVLLAVTIQASGAEEKPTTTAPAKTPQQLADQYYNTGLSYRDKAWKLEKDLGSADATTRAQLDKKIRQNYERAIDAYRQALAEAPKMFEASSSLGYALRKTGDYEQALTAYDEALAIEPNYPEAIEYRGEAYLGLGRIDDAKQAYMQLFGNHRTYADELLEAMQEWVKSAPQGVDASSLEAFSSWIDERAEIAGNTTPVSQLREKSW